MEIPSDLEKKYTNPLVFFVIICAVCIIASDIAIYFWQDTGPELLVVSLLQDLFILGIIILIGKSLINTAKKKHYKKYKRFFQLFKKAANPVWEIQLPDMNILEINDAAIKRYGYKGHKLFGRSFADLFSQQDKTNFEASLLSANQEGFKSLGIFMHKSFYGERFHVKLQASLYEEDGIRRCFVVAHDVEQDLIQNAEIASTRDYLERVLDSIGNGMMIVDEHFRIIKVNKAFTQILGKESEKILRLPVSQALPLWDEAGITEKIESVLISKSSLREEFFDAANQRWFSIAMFYFENGVSVFILDITDQKNKIENQFINEKTLTSLISYSGDAIFFADREKKIRFFNNAFENWYIKFTGMAPKRNGLLFQEEHMKLFLDQWELRFDKAISGQALSIYERIPDPANPEEMLFFHSIYNALFDDKGDLIGVGGFARDLTDLKNNEQILNQLNNKLNNTLQQIINGFISVDAEMCILDVNPTIEKMLQISKSDVIGRSANELLRINQNATQEFNLQECMTSNVRKEGVLHLEHLGIWLEYIAYPDPLGQVIDIYFNDITIRKNIENELLDSLRKYELVAKVSNDIIWEWEFANNQIDWSHGLKIGRAHV